MPLSSLPQGSPSLGFPGQQTGGGGAAPKQGFGFGGQVSVKKRGTLDMRLLDQFSRLAELGLFGEGGISQIAGARRRGEKLGRRNLTTSLERKFGRRMGSRSGAAQQLVANRVQGPGLQRESDYLSNLIQMNEQSKLAGLQGGLNVFNSQTSRISADAQKKESEGGGLFGDIMGIITEGAKAFAKSKTGNSGGGGAPPA